MKTYYQISLLNKETGTENAKIFIQRDEVFATFNHLLELLGIQRHPVETGKKVPFSAENDQFILSISRWQNVEK